MMIILELLRTAVLLVLALIRQAFRGLKADPAEDLPDSTIQHSINGKVPSKTRDRIDVLLPYELDFRRTSNVTLHGMIHSHIQDFGREAVDAVTFDDLESKTDAISQYIDIKLRAELHERGIILDDFRITR